MTVRGSADPDSTGPDSAGQDSNSQDAKGETQEAQRLVRILRMDTRQVMLFSHTSGSVHCRWMGRVTTTLCERGRASGWWRLSTLPGLPSRLGWWNPIAIRIWMRWLRELLLASACLPNGARHLTAFARDREKDHARLWDLTLPPTKVWPQWATSGDGMRFARSTLEVSHPIGIYSPLDDADVRGQSVQVYDLATGTVQLTAPLSPVLDGGGNFALSPSGRRLAVLNDGVIQIFDLGPVAALAPAPKAAAKP